MGEWLQNVLQVIPKKIQTEQCVCVCVCVCYIYVHVEVHTSAYVGDQIEDILLYHLMA